ncbi:MAG: hypothetical protein JWP74_35 [Marmoricola sp.]|nr:hypothetical protein [Marmoricola sp.]
MLDTFQGLPVHALIVHATVAAVPTAAFLVALASVYPRFRAWIGPLPVIAALISVVLVPLTTMSGHKLEDHLGPLPLIKKHEHLAGTLKYFVVALALIAIISALVHRRGGASTVVVAVVAVLAVGIGIGTMVDVALIGHSGAKAVWSGAANLHNGR